MIPSADEKDATKADKLSPKYTYMLGGNEAITDLKETTCCNLKESATAKRLHLLLHLRFILAH